MPSENEQASRTLPITRSFDESYTRASAFSYTCHACSRCCHDKIIRVNPYEIGRLAKNRQLNTTEFHSLYTTANGTALKQTADGACVFLTPQGCGVHPDRPLVCRLYPLGRRVTAAGQETFYELSPHPQTKGRYGTNGTVQDFLDHQGAQAFIDAVERYVELLSRTASVMQTIMQNSNLADEMKLLHEDASHAGANEVPSWLDMDQAVARYCGARHMPVPEDIEAKMDLHLQAIEAWIGHS